MVGSTLRKRNKKAMQIESFGYGFAFAFGMASSVSFRQENIGFYMADKRAHRRSADQQLYIPVTHAALAGEVETCLRCLCERVFRFYPEGHKSTFTPLFLEGVPILLCSFDWASSRGTHAVLLHRYDKAIGPCHGR